MRRRSIASRASFTHGFLVAGMRLLRLDRQSAEEVRASIRTRDSRSRRARPPKPPQGVVDGLRVSRSDRDGWAVWTLSGGGPEEESRRVVVALHGGAYVLQITRGMWALYAGWARTGAVDVIVPVYPLAPHGNAEEAVTVVADIITEQVREHGADRVGVEGDSAGGGLALAAVQELVARGVEVPSRMVLISPWLDLAVSDPRSLSIKDPFLSLAGLRECGRQWAGDLDVDDPKVSPLNGSLRGLPHIDVYAGTLDLLCPDTLRLQETAVEQSLDMTFDVREGLCHGWAGFGLLPEAKAVAATIASQLTGPRQAGRPG